jgi:ATP adenylyltransferase
MADKTLWAPWRASFILGKRERGCIFCNRLKKKDSPENRSVDRGSKAFVILNKYPYNAGHIMIVPNRHIGQLDRLTLKESREFFELTRSATTVLKKTLKPNSMNLGMNLGRASGAGVPGHLHMHIVPRWTGDTNFMPVVGETKVLSVPLGPIYEELRRGFQSI